MIDQFVEGFNKIRKPLLTGYCFLFLLWLYEAPQLLDTGEDKPATTGVENAELRDLGLNADQAESLSDLWAAMPASAQAAAVAFLALSIGGAINTLFYTAVTRFAWNIYKNMTDEARFGYHATLCLTITGGVIILLDARWDSPSRLGLSLVAAAAAVYLTTLFRSKLDTAQHTNIKEDDRVEAASEAEQRRAADRRLVDARNTVRARMWRICDESEDVEIAGGAIAIYGYEAMEMLGVEVFHEVVHDLQAECVELVNHAYKVGDRPSEDQLYRGRVAPHLNQILKKEFGAILNPTLPAVIRSEPLGSDSERESQ